MNDKIPIRGELLNKALQATVSDRNKTYGEPIEQFTRHAELCSAYFGVQFSPHDIAMFLLLCKISRVPGSYTHEDTYVDGAAYFAIAGEMASYGAFSDKTGQLKSPASLQQGDGGSTKELPGKDNTVRSGSPNLASAPTGIGGSLPATGQNSSITSFLKKP